MGKEKKIDDSRLKKVAGGTDWSTDLGDGSGGNPPGGGSLERPGGGPSGGGPSGQSSSGSGSGTGSEQSSDLD